MKIFICGFLLLLAGCLSQRVSIVPSSSAGLNSIELSNLQQQAKKGDMQAALRVYGYYLVYVGNVEMAKEYLLIAAEGGLSIAQYNMGILILTNYPSDRHLARGWFEKAAASGDKLAIEKLADRSIWTEK